MSVAQELSWREYWEGIDDTQKVFRIEATDYVRRVREEIRPTKEMRVLDFGCGFGHAAEAIAPFVREVLLWDASSSALTRAAARIEALHNATVVDLTDESGDFRLGELDIVLVHSVIQYMSSDEVESWLQRWRRIVSPQGKLVLSDLLVPGSGGLDEVAAYLQYALSRGFFWDAFLSGLKEVRYYSRARRERPLAIVEPHLLEEVSRGAGWKVEWLGRNLSHRRRRATALLTPMSAVD